MSTVITPLHLALLDAVGAVVSQSGVSPGEATQALVDTIFGVAADATEDAPEDRQELAQLIAGRAFHAAWRPSFRDV